MEIDTVCKYLNFHPVIGAEFQLTFQYQTTACASNPTIMVSCIVGRIAEQA
jgi:hypothetical protein